MTTMSPAGRGPGPLVIRTTLGLTWIVVAPSEIDAVETDALIRLGGWRTGFVAESISVSSSEPPSAMVLMWPGSERSPSRRDAAVEQLRRRRDGVALLFGESLARSTGSMLPPTTGVPLRILGVRVPCNLERTFHVELSREQ